MNDSGKNVGQAGADAMLPNDSAASTSSLSQVVTQCIYLLLKIFTKENISKIVDTVS